MANLRRITRERVALGGYRLAALLNALLADVPLPPAPEPSTSDVTVVLAVITCMLAVMVLALGAYARRMFKRQQRRASEEEWTYHNLGAYN
jgi:hypothetical protein